MSPRYLAKTLHNLNINATANNSYGIYFATDTTAHTFLDGAQNTRAGGITGVESFTTEIAATDTIYVAAWSEWLTVHSRRKYGILPHRYQNLFN